MVGTIYGAYVNDRINRTHLMCAKSMLAALCHNILHYHYFRV